MFLAIENHRPELTDVDGIQGRIKRESDLEVSRNFDISIIFY